MLDYIGPHGMSKCGISNKIRWLGVLLFFNIFYSDLFQRLLAVNVICPSVVPGECPKKKNDWH